MPEGLSKQTGWTVDTLHVHLDGKLEAQTELIQGLFKEAEKRYEQRFLAQQEAMRAALAAQEKAVSVAETNSDKWRANANEWRATLTDRDTKFMLKETAEANFVSLTNKIDDLRQSRDTATGKGKGYDNVFIYIVGIITMIAVVVGAVYEIVKH